MVRFFLICNVIFFISAYAQVNIPELINYQGIARNASGDPLVNLPNLQIKLNIRQGNPAGNIIFSETHGTSTNGFGIFILQIGSQNPSAFKNISWASGPYFMEISMDVTGTNNFTLVGTQQLISVPYSLYSKTSYSSENVPSPTLSVISTNTLTGDYTLQLQQGTHTSTVGISNSSGNAWKISGNSGTDPLQHFIGTQDSAPLIFKTGGTEKMRMMPSVTATSGILGIGTSAPEAFLHLYLPNSSFNKVLQFGHGNQPNKEWIWGVDASSVLRLSNEGNGSPFNLLTLTSDGNLGIGTNPIYHFQSSYTGTKTVAHYFNYDANSSSASHCIYALAQNNNSGDISAGFFWVSSSPSASLSSGVKVMNTANSTHNHGILSEVAGTGGPFNYGGKFKAGNASQRNYGIYAEATSSSLFNIGGYFSASGGTSNFAAIFDHGLVGIGTGTPLAKLHLNNFSPSTLNAFKIEHNNAGPAVEILCGSSSTNALHILNGHIKSSSPVPSHTNIGCNSWITCGPPSLHPSSTDVSGYIEFSCSSCTLQSYSWYEGEINFTKNYTSTPHIVLTPYLVSSTVVTPNPINVILTQVTNSGFRYRVSVTTNNLAVTNVRVYYFVLEGN